MEDATLRVDVVVRQIQLTDAGTRIIGRLTSRAGTGNVRVQELLLNRPVNLSIDAAVVAGLDSVQGALPQVQGVFHVTVVRAVLLHVLACRIQVVTLNAQRRVVLTVRGFEGCGAGQVVADGAQSRRDGHNIQARDREAILQHTQHQVGAGNLQQGRRLRHVRIAINDVHAAELRSVSVRLIAGVNERASARGRGGRRLPNVVGTLRERVRRHAGAGRRVGRTGHRATLRVGLTGTDQDLAGHQERNELGNQVVELQLATDQVVLMAAVGVARRIHVVLEQVQLTVEGAALRTCEQALAGGTRQISEKQLTGAFLHEQLINAAALGGGVLGVRTHVKVEPAAVGQEDVR